MKNKDLIDKKGKATLNNHRTSKDEVNTLKNIARRSVEANNRREKDNDYAIVPIGKTERMILLSKFNKNKEKYEKEATGKIRFSHAKK